MILLFTVAAICLVAFAVIELAGVFNPATEDTFTEWVADLDLIYVLAIGGLSAVVGAFGIWSLGHYLEWWGRRKQQ
jgi:hypothetical protein